MRKGRANSKDARLLISSFTFTSRSYALQMSKSSGPFFPFSLQDGTSFDRASPGSQFPQFNGWKRDQRPIQIL